MSEPGWYPDPAGRPHHYRYWDGAAWGNETLENPAASASQPGTPYAGAQEGSRKGGLWLPIAIVAAVLVAAVLLWAVLRPGDGDSAGGDDNSSSPTISAWDETSSPTPTPSDTESSNGTKVDCPRSNGTAPGRMEGNRRVGGKLSFESRGWQKGGFLMAFTHDVSAETRTIQFGWNSNLAVGALSVADGFEEPAASATMMLQCLASSDYYRTYTGTKQISSEKVTIDGKPGHKIVADVHVSSPGNVEGDRVTVIVVDTGDPESLSFFASAATIVNEQNLAEVADTEKTLKVEG